MAYLEVKKLVFRQPKWELKIDAEFEKGSCTAIIGRSGAGKSTLLNKLTGADVHVADKLFATLDPTSRRLELPSGRPLVLTDTVGFVRNLPHRLIDAFKATLEEAVVADFLLQVIDLSSGEVEEQQETTSKVLEDFLGRSWFIIFPPNEQIS